MIHHYLKHIIIFYILMESSFIYIVPLLLPAIFVITTKFVSKTFSAEKYIIITQKIYISIK